MIVESVQDIINSILDDNNEDLIKMFDENKKPVIYEQVALIPFDNHLYAILADQKALSEGDEASADVFMIDEEKCKITLVNNVNTISEVFEIFDRMLQENENN